MSKVNKIKNWLKKQMKNKKFVITTIIFFVLLVAVVFGITISFSGILGSTYDIDNIEKNIDKIKVGDSINYTANGYNDWKVLSIDKENKTMEIISRTSTEDVEIKSTDVDNYLDILQATANKYMDGKYAIDARSIITNNNEYGMVEELGYWVARDSSCLEHSTGSICVDNHINGYYMPVVTLNVGDTSGFYVNNNYNYSLNGISDWTILYVNENGSISIVPSSSIYFLYEQSEQFPNLSLYIESEIAKFKDDNVLDVRAYSSKDASILDRCSSADLYTGKVNRVESYEENGELLIKYDKYFLESIDGCNDETNETEFTIASSFTNGFVPVVTIKYGQPEGKNVSSKLKVGDYVKYSANAYDSWKVLNIDEEKNTVEVVSTSGVKELTLKGKEDYDNYEDILQTEVNRYKNGDIAISARTLEEYDDFETLVSIDVPLVKKNRFVFINKKNTYRDKDYNRVDYRIYTFKFDESNISLSISNGNFGHNTTLYSTAIDSELEQMSATGSQEYSVTAQLLPVITLKLSEVEKVSEGTVDNNSNNSTNTNKNNNTGGQSSSVDTNISEEKSEEEDKEVVGDNNYNEVLEELSKLTTVVNDLENQTKEENIKNRIFLTLIIGLICFSFIYFARRK